MILHGKYDLRFKIRYPAPITVNSQLAEKLYKMQGFVQAEISRLLLSLEVRSQIVDLK